MAINRSVGQHQVSVAEAQLARVAGDGCARHNYLNSLLEASGRHSGRDLADAVHLLCNLHGRYPGLIELALQRCPKGAAQDWLTRASDAFERERLYVVRLTSAVGLFSNDPGATETEASLVAARHALETLAMSEREGCALGAATALIGDWWPIRRVLDRASARVSLECPAPCSTCSKPGRVLAETIKPPSRIPAARSRARPAQSIQLEPACSAARLG